MATLRQGAAGALPASASPGASLVSRLSRERGPRPAVWTLISTVVVPYFGGKMHFDV